MCPVSTGGAGGGHALRDAGVVRLVLEVSATRAARREPAAPRRAALWLRFARVARAPRQKVVLNISTASKCSTRKLLYAGQRAARAARRGRALGLGWAGAGAGGAAGARVCLLSSPPYTESLGIAEVGNGSGSGRPRYAPAPAGGCPCAFAAGALAGGGAASGLAAGAAGAA